MCYISGTKSEQYTSIYIFSEHLKYIHCLNLLLIKGMKRGGVFFKILLLVDNTPVHPRQTEINVIFTPMPANTHNTHSVVQEFNFYYLYSFNYKEMVTLYTWQC